jgi:hypothetical protein
VVDFDEVGGAVRFLDFAEEEELEVGHLYMSERFIKYFLPKN